MEDNQTNMSNATNDEGSLVTAQTHIVLHFVLILICALTLLLSIWSAAALLITKRINTVMRILLLNKLLSNGEFTLGLVMWFISFPVRYYSNVMLQDDDISCRVIGGIFIAGAVGRFTSVVLFCVGVFMLVMLYDIHSLLHQEEHCQGW